MLGGVEEQVTPWANTLGLPRRVQPPRQRASAQMRQGQSGRGIDRAPPEPRMVRCMGGSLK